MCCSRFALPRSQMWGENSARSNLAQRGFLNPSNEADPTLFPNGFGEFRIGAEPSHYYEYGIGSTLRSYVLRWARR